MLFNISVSERHIKYAYGRNQHYIADDNFKVRAR